MTRLAERGIDARSSAHAGTSSGWKPALRARVIALEALLETCQANSSRLRFGRAYLWHNRYASPANTTLASQTELARSRVESEARQISAACSDPPRVRQPGEVY